MQTKAPILAIDGNNLAHRAYHRAKYNPSSDAVAEFAKTVSMLQTATELRYGLKPITIVAFDPKGGYERDSWCPTYKDGRATKDADVGILLDLLPQVCKAAGIRALVVDGWEADDVTATLAVKAESYGHCAVIATSDKDALGRVGEFTAVHRIHAGEKPVWVTPEVFEAEYGFSPHRYLEFAALRGDSSDNLPGVTGIGPKRATALINGCDDVVEAIRNEEDLSEWVGKKPAANAVEEKDRFLLNIRMMTLNTDLDLDLAVGTADLAKLLELDVTEAAITAWTSIAAT